jgi:hypothetical protein
MMKTVRIALLLISAWLAGAGSVLAQQTPFATFVTGLAPVSSIIGTERIYALQTGINKTVTPYQILSSVSGDCAIAAPPSIVCTKTGGVAFVASATTDTTNAANIGSGTLLAGRMPAFTGDCTTSAGAVATNCTKTGGVAFAASATADTTNASNISSGTLANARSAAVNLAAGAVNGGVTGLLPFANHPSGSQDTALGYWTGTVLSATAVPNCAGSLTYSTTTHTYGCNVGAGSGTLTNVATTYPISGGPITTTGTLTSVAPTNSGQLTFTSTTALAFKPYNGDTIKINGTVFQIPSAGIAGLGNPTSVFLDGVAAQTLAINTTYYIYVFNNGGTLTADFSVTGHTTSATAGNVGTEIKTGVGSRTLIGMVQTGGTVIYASDIQTASWLNRRNKTFAANQAATSTTTTAINFVTWAEEAFTISTSGTFDSLTGPGNVSFQNRLDSSAVGFAYQGTSSTAGFYLPFTAIRAMTSTEGNHAFDGIFGASTPSLLGGESYVEIRG